MHIQADGVVITVTRRGYPDTPEMFSGGGFVVLAHDDPATGLCYTTTHDKALFDQDVAACVAAHLAKTRPREGEKRGSKGHPVGWPAE